MDLKNKEILKNLLRDFEDFANMRGINYPSIYLVGGSGAILGNYFNRATLDIDFLDMNYPAEIGKLFKLFDTYDMLDMYLTTVPLSFKKRVKKLKNFSNIYVLSKEDLILSKIGRYSEKDIEDIGLLIIDTDICLINALIDEVINRIDISEIVLKEFRKNLIQFKDDFNV